MKYAFNLSLGGITHPGVSSSSSVGGKWEVSWSSYLASIGTASRFVQNTWQWFYRLAVLILH